ncbi:MAG: hypothetical protein KF760_18225 [Candidatus Eremiobacteraeota bacterium]|nr:hypothetical protein [Candidatus Eremiobacteraeota bacterium]MCW5866733.1 hypothetical protein [Candidatus Eremiobacteraeota bacterium]
MEGASKLEQFIDGALSEGSLDSSGSFTIDWQHALSKIGDLSRQYPARWVYFLAQAGVAARALGLNVSCSRASISVEILLDQETFTPDQVLDQSGQRSKAAAFLYSALLWAQALGPQSVELLCQDAQGGSLYRLAAGSETRQTLPPAYRRVVMLYRPAAADADFKKLVTLLSHQLGSALRYCPLPLFLDSRPLAQGEALQTLPKSGPTQAYRIFRRLVLAPPEASAALAAAPPHAWPAHRIFLDGFPEICGPKSDESLGILEIAGPLAYPPMQTARAEGNQLPLLPDWVLPLDYSPWIGSLIRCHATFFRVRRSLGKLQLVHYGLGLEVIDLPALAEDGWGIVVANHSIQTDFSGLKAVENDKYRQLLDWVCDSVAHTYARMADRGQAD